MKCVYKTETTVILAAILQVAAKANYITIIYCMKNVFRFLNCQKKLHVLQQAVTASKIVSDLDEALLLCACRQEMGILCLRQKFEDFDITRYCTCYHVNEGST